MRGLTVAFLVLAGLAVLGDPGTGQEPEPVVHAVLFYSSTCPHCHQLITETLIPMQEEYGSKLVILGLETSQDPGNSLYWEALRYYEIPQDDWVVPILIVDDQVMVGGLEIPERFPDMVEQGLAGDGIDLPDFPALISSLREQGMLDQRFPGRRIALQDPPIGVRPERETSGQEAAPGPDAPPAGPEAEPQVGDTLSAAPADTTTSAVPDSASGGPVGSGGPAGSGEEGSPAQAAPRPGASPGGAGMDLGQAARDMESRTMGERFNQDPAGNSLSVVVLLLMVLSLVLKGWPPRARGKPWPSWVVPILVVVGMGVAAYLSYIEITHVEAVCGPVGDCDTVNQSEYATLFGVLPVGVAGLGGYFLILVLWALGRFGSEGTHRLTALGIWGAALFGTLFSLYLTFLEPFVIGATCAWCLTSAMVMTLLLWASASAAREVWAGKEAHER